MRMASKPSSAPQVRICATSAATSAASVGRRVSRFVSSAALGAGVGVADMPKLYAMPTVPPVDTPAGLNSPLAERTMPLVDEATRSLQKRGVRSVANPPTALFCPADSIAALVYRALATRGLLAGRDISVISCHHERSLVASLWPSLATIDVHPERIGQLAVELLARRLSGEFSGGAVQISVSPTYVPGGSIKRCRDQSATPSRAAKHRP